MSDIEIDFSQLNDKATEFWCMCANARKGQKEAVLNENQDAAIYFGAALGAYIDVLAMALPEELRPDGQETNKP